MDGKMTFTMIKPRAVAMGYMGHILNRINEAGFKIIALKYTKLTKEDAEIFYKVHKGKPFFAELVEFMSSGPIVAAVLYKDNAVLDFRKLIGSTDPAEADEGTIRYLYAKNKTANAIHGSDSDENAIREAGFFFAHNERFYPEGCEVEDY